MKPVRQTVRGACGNCHAACVASILELPIEQMPNHFLSENGDVDPSWLNVWNGFLRPFGLGMIWSEARCCRVPTGYSIAGVRNSDGSHHAVVYLNGAPVHDPLGGKGETGPVDYWYIFTALDPSRNVVSNV